MSKLQEYINTKIHFEIMRQMYEKAMSRGELTSTEMFAFQHALQLLKQELQQLEREVVIATSH